MSSVITAGADPDLVSMLDTVFGRQAAGGARPGGLDREFWGILESLGLTRLTQSESRGGSGAGWPEAAALLSAAAQHAVPVPVTEHDLLAGWLLETAGLERPLSHLCGAAVLDTGGRARGVGWASQAETLALLWPTGDQWQAAAVPVKAVHVTSDDGHPTEPRGTVEVDLAALSPCPVPAWLAPVSTARVARPDDSDGGGDGNRGGSVCTARR